MCQSPIYQDTHFYLIRKDETLLGWMCQSPIYQDTHFYKKSSSGRTFPIIGVNPLSIRTPISTWFKRHPKTTVFASVNPLSIRTPISTSRKLFRVHRKALTCQSPIYQDTHFYPHPQNCLNLCDLPASILQVFIRQF